MSNNKSLLISFCLLRDIDVWRAVSTSLCINTNFDSYWLFVPKDDIDEFIKVTDKRFSIFDENSLDSGWNKKLSQKMINLGTESRIGWYRQQFLKLSALNKASNEFDELVIWDADTMPVNRLIFFDDMGRPLLRKGLEFHPNYFSTIKKIMGIEKVFKYSFIAQCFPLRSKMVNDFFDYLTNNSGKTWFDIIIDNIDFSKKSSFSEYETIGTYLYQFHRSSISISNERWFRYGYDLGSPEAVYDLYNGNTPLGYIAFEKWALHRSFLRRLYTKFVFKMYLINKNIGTGRI
jgi:hypothetical protein